MLWIFPERLLREGIVSEQRRYLQILALSYTPKGRSARGGKM